MRIQHNIMAMNAYRNYNANNKALSGNLEKLSSGYKINRAGDDAAGLAISEKMRAQITGLDAAQKNVKDGTSLVKTAEGAMQEIHDMLNRMDYLATQSANGTYDDEVDRANLQKEVDSLKAEINRIADSANFNGIKLLDGSLDTESTTTISADSAISNIQTTDYAAKGASPAFEATYVTNRPEASTTQTNASFTVSLDDLGFTGQVKKDEKFELTIGSDKISYTVQADGDVKTAADLAGKLKNCGYAMDTTNNKKFVSGKGVADADTTLKDTTAEWKKNTGKGTADQTGADATKNFIEIGGHWYEMSATGKDLTFTQVDYMGTSGETINPNFDVSIKYTRGTGNTTEMTGTVNDHVQKTSSGIGIGSSHQAQVDLSIDFSQLKDGDKLTIGNFTYVFKIGKDSTTAASGNDKLIDLSAILKEDADLADEAKLKKAMTTIVNAIDGKDVTGTAVTNPTWTAGNFGIDGTTGTISFQSKSDYTDDTKEIGTGGNVTTGVGGTDESLKANMTTEALVMRQFKSERGTSNATTSFEVDVTKIKKGDTFSINGVKFEFTDTAQASDPEANAIDLSSIGNIDGDKLLESQTVDVLKKIKDKVSAVLGADKFTVTNSGNKLTIESLDNAATAVKEQKVSAKVELSKESYGGKALMLQIGDTSDSFNQLKVSVGDMHTKAMGTKDGKSIADIDIGNQEGAAEAVDVIKNAINYVSSVRGDLGAIQNRLDHTANNLSVMAENIQDAESTIRDTDVADEMMKYVKNNILVQSAQAMLAQANQLPQGVLQLLG